MPRTQSTRAESGEVQAFHKAYTRIAPDMQKEALFKILVNLAVLMFSAPAQPEQPDAGKED